MYLTQATEIKGAIDTLALETILWVDTETADWKTKYPKISLIQVLINPDDRTGESAYILDVLDRPQLVAYFLQKIISNPKIEKVFHHASYDLKFLGKKQAKNITCTYQLARKISKKRLGTSNLKLKTLAVELCGFTQIDCEPQSSDWRRRPLSEKQLHYAKLDTVYLAHVHRQLLEFIAPKYTQTEEEIFVPTAKLNDPSFSVTNVRVAFECPRLFYLERRFGGKTVFLPKTQYAAIGNPFHQLAQKFVELAIADTRFRSLLTPAAEQLQAEEVAQEMQQLFYTIEFYPYLQSVVGEKPHLAPTLYQIWQGVCGLIRHYAQLLVANRYHCHADTILPQTFVDRELRVQAQFKLPDGTTQLVRGQFDSLVYDVANRRLCAVEYKTYQAADLSAQVAQVALYAYMLQQQKRKPVDAAVYCVLPEFRAYQFPWEELDRTVHQLIPHKLAQMRQWLAWEPPQPNPPPPTSQSKLCEICPQQQKCQGYFPPVETPVETPAKSASSPTRKNRKTPSKSNPPSHIPASPPPRVSPSRESPTRKNRKTPSKPNPPSPVSPSLKSPSQKNQKTSSPIPASPRPRVTASSPPTPEVDAITEQLVTVLQAFGVDVDYQGAAVGPAFVRVKLKPKLGVKVSSILTRKEDLQVQLGIPALPLIAPQAGYVSVDLPRSDRQIAYFEQYVQPTSTPATAPVRIAIGVNLDGKLVEADLSDPNTCHFLVGGTTGSGKSEFLRALLLSLLQRRSPPQLKIALVDPKRVTFPEFEGIPWLLSPVVKDCDRAVELMEELVEEMERRYRLFEACGCNDLSSYNQKRIDRDKPPEPAIICIFDEYADFMTDKEIKNPLEGSIKRLGAMARAAGIHLIIATQRPEAKVVTPIIRSNLPGRIALRTASEADSAIVLGGSRKEAAYLLGKGDLLYQAGASLHRLQSLFANAIDLVR